MQINTIQKYFSTLTSVEKAQDIGFSVVGSPPCLYHFHPLAWSLEVEEGKGHG
jgi:hypothetical protein